MNTETRSLLCPLSDEDFRVRAHNLAAKRIELSELKLEQKASAARYGQQLKDLDAEIVELAAVVKAKHETRPVTVEWQKDLKHGLKRLVRLDTNDVIDTKALTLDEKQSTLNFGSSAKKAEDAAKNGNGASAAPANGEKKGGKKAKAAKAPTTEPTASA